jgi:hypothetical protein
LAPSETPVESKGYFSRDRDGRRHLRIGAVAVAIVSGVFAQPLYSLFRGHSLSEGSADFIIGTVGVLALVTFGLIRDFRKQES